MDTTSVKNITSQGIDKTAIKNFAVYARNKLMKDIRNKAAMIGITENGIQDPLTTSTGNIQLFDIGMQEPYSIEGKAIAQRNGLIRELKKREQGSTYLTAYEALIEEVAYTWFNRIIAIRFMEVNNYIPNRMRILSSGVEGINEPEFITNVFETNFEFSKEEKAHIIELKMDGSNLAMDELFQYLFIKQCNSLNVNLPELFEKTNDYTELLLTVSYNDIEGIIYKLVHNVPEMNFDVNSENGNGQVEIIGWLYQYYNSERKDEVINVLGGKVIKKEDIPAATQLFTTDWVVRYMVDNSLGKYWLERNPYSNLDHSLEYLVSKDIEKVDEKISPEDIKFLDNCMGSGHILVYAFDVLMKMYESEGYATTEAARLIVEKNLFGLEIDKRSYQLSYFAIMMKARQYNRRILNENLQNNLYVFQDSTSINQDHIQYLGHNLSKEERKNAIRQLSYLIELFTNAEELGSIIIIEGDLDAELLLNFIEDFDKQGQISFETIGVELTQQQLRDLFHTANLLKQKYEVVVTNPPYMNKFDKELKRYIKDKYKDYSGDLFSVFIYRNIELLKENGYSAYMSPFVWMFIKTYEKLREYIIETKHISSLIQMEYSAFEEATVPICSFVLRNKVLDQKGDYIKLSDFKGGMGVQRLKTLEGINNPNCNYIYEFNQSKFKQIPGSPIAYWVSSQILKIYGIGTSLGSIAAPRKGNSTSNNNRFLRYWFEVVGKQINIGSSEIDIADTKKRRWIPYNKGGGYRKWYGNNEYVIDWLDDAKEIRSIPTSVIANYQYFMKPGLTWSTITSSNFSIRSFSYGFIFDNGGCCIFELKDKESYVLALLNSKVFMYTFGQLNPTLNFQSGEVAKFPIIFIEDSKKINLLVEENVEISKKDWDSFETSWDFIRHPLIQPTKLISEAFKQWSQFAEDQINTLRGNEEELNRLFIDIYGLKEELIPEVNLNTISLRKPNLNKDIRSFISYAVGCIFGRYNVDQDKITFTGQESKLMNYSTLLPKIDNVIFISNQEFLSNDIVSLFEEFIVRCYGQSSLEENLKFIACALDNKTSSAREVIRNYFLNDFYKDHTKTYKKRPIYWLYDSGKQNGFKALVYMHRYDEDTTGKVRVEYLHQVQRAYERTITNLQEDIANSIDAKEATQLQKRLEKIIKQLKECRDYDEHLGHMALERVAIDLDDGVKVNYEKIQTDNKGKVHQILAKIK